MQQSKINFYPEIENEQTEELYIKFCLYQFLPCKNRCTLFLRRNMQRLFPKERNVICSFFSKTKKKGTAPHVLPPKKQETEPLLPAC